MPRHLTVWNPQSRFVSSAVAYDEGEAPNAEIEVFEDHSKSILSTNDSPDIWFRWSVNPYRGCLHSCAYCMDGETRIRMSNGDERTLRELHVGDEIVGSTLEGGVRRLTKTRVLAHWRTRKAAFRITLDDGTQLVASADHRFLTPRGWRYVAPEERSVTRPSLTTADRLVKASGEDRLEASPSIVAIEALGREMAMFDITTETGDFIANGVVSHNCYARPSHEYLSFGAGTDFERKIVVKPRAAELLRESFDRKSWRGELVVFSGVTDCYQPLESKLRLTRACLEVCAEYRNPVGIITKSPLVERDIDVLQELTRVASVTVSVSVPFWDPDVARAMEPMVTTPERRMKTVERLAKAGISTGVSVAPIVPGLNDEDLGAVIERSSNAGAEFAFYVLLRLPGPVRETFEQALREKLPLRADKVLRRLREAYGGKLYDASFGTRGRGNGPYIDAIRMLFERTIQRYGMNSDERRVDELSATFRRPSKHGQTSFDF